VLKGLGPDSFELHGRRIDLSLERQAITYVKALGEGHAISADVDLVADTIGLDLDQEQLVQTIAWGDSLKPRALTADYEIRGDSLAFDTPGQQLSEIRAFTGAWVGGKLDTLSRERDWITGDTIVASFARRDSAGTRRATLRQLAAAGSARSYYRIVDEKTNQARVSINYSRGDRITVRMKTSGPRAVDRVKIDGHVDGVHLRPVIPEADTTGSAATPAKGGR